MKKTLFIVLLTLLLSSCQRSCTKWSKDLQMTEKDITIHMYSGGDTVFTDSFRGIVNNSEHSDGVYYYKGDTLVEVSGDYVIKTR